MAKTSKLVRYLIVPDCHVPYHDRFAFGLMVHAATSVGCRNVALLGDFADCFAVSAHPKSPERKASFEWEMDEVNASLRVLEKAFPGDKRYVFGNHEHRVARFIRDRAPELFGTVDLKRILHLHKWQVTDYTQHDRIGKLYITHDLGKAGQSAHLDAQRAFESNVVIGHTHRMSYSVVGSQTGDSHVCAMLGWLGDVEQLDYGYRGRAMRDHVLGFGMAYLDPSTGNTYVTPVPIVGGKCMLEGKLYT